MTDKVVKQIQRLLDGLGHSPGKIDGIWGSRSQAALDAAEKQYCKQNSFDSLVEATVGDWWNDIKYFKRSEFRCKCGGKYCDGYPAEPQEILLRAADKVREHFGKPMLLSSGLRCEVWNAKQGGVAGSRHRLGKAMDFCIPGVSAAKIDAYVGSLPEIRYHYCIDGSYVHMDIL